MNDQAANASSLPASGTARAKQVDAGAPEGAPRISGEFIRQALLGKAEIPPGSPLTINDRGARLEGVIVEGGLDLSAVKFDRPIAFKHCTFHGPINLCDARLGHVRLAQIQAPLLILRRAEITGDLELSGVALGSQGQVAFDGTAMQASGSIAFTDGSVTEGVVLLQGTRLGRALVSRNAEFRNWYRRLPSELPRSKSSDFALCLDGVTIPGGAALIDSAIEGFALFDSAKMASMELDNCRIARGSGMLSGLSLLGCRIEGPILLRRLGKFEGVLNLTDTAAESLVDDGSCWKDPSSDAPRSEVELKLDEFRYGTVARDVDESGDLSWQSRLAWLKMQPTAHWTSDFRSQPFTQCARVLSNIGDAHGSRMILFERERLRLRSKHVGFWEKLGGHILGVLAGYGYKNHFALYWALGIWLLGGLVFGVADYLGEMRPADPHVLVEAHYQETLRPPTDYEPVDPLLYSADILLPIVELGQQEYWIPRNAGEHIADVDHAFPNLARPIRSMIAWAFGGWLPKAYYYFEIFMGWLLVSIVIAGFSGLLGHAKEE